MIKKKTFRIVSLVVIFCLTLTFTVFAASHKNLPPGQAKKLVRYNFDYNTSADFMKEKGIIKGYGNGDFGFDDYVKRGDIIVMIVRAFNINTIINKYVENFDDVEYDSYYYDAIITAKSNGIAKGYDKKFNPKKYVTIEEAIALIERSVALANNNVIIDKSVDLRDLYEEDELSNNATRSDIANMIYYVLTGDEYDEEDKEDEDIDTIKYTIKENTILTFDDNKLMNEFEDVTDDEFDYVKFDLPLRSEGRLYYDYTSATNYDSLVKDSTKYYDNTNPSISDITFVPKTNYTGNVSIKYTAYDEDENAYEGIINIVVEEYITNLEPIKYSIKENTNKVLDEDDFIEVLEDVTNNDLNYVKFELPSQTYGKLYYDYKSVTNYDPVVTQSSKYFVDSSNYISKVFFVPKSNYDGLVKIYYTAYDEDGYTYKGLIEITVE